jgi:hypothetical protein
MIEVSRRLADPDLLDDEQQRQEPATGIGR